MQKKLFVILLSLLFVSPWVQGFPKGSRVVILNSKNLIPYYQAIQGVKQILGKETPVYEMNANPHKGKILVNYAISNGAKVIVAVGALAVEVAEKQSQVPVVFTMILHSEKFLVSNRNTTGVYMDIPVKIQFQTLASAFPHITRIGVIYDPAKTGDEVQTGKGAAANLGLTLFDLPISSSSGVPRALKKLLKNKIQSLWMVPDSTVYTSDSFAYINERLIEHHIPFFVFSKEFVRIGGLLALSPKYTEIGKEAGELALKILNGVRANQIPPKFPDRFDLYVNRHVLRETGIKISSTVLSAAKMIK